MIKTQQRGKRIQLTRTSKPNFSIRSLTEEGVSPQFFLDITSITNQQSALSKQIKMMLEEEINSMLDQVSKIINQNSLNIREAMNYVRSSILFKEIDQINNNVVNEIVGQFARNRIQSLEAALQEKTRQLQQFKNELRQEKDFNQQNLKINRVQKLELPKQNEHSDILILYNKAKTSSYREFEETFKQRQMSNRLQIVQINNITPKSKRQSTKLFDFKQEKKGKLMKVLTPLLNNLNEEQRADLLEVLKEELSNQCQNPCCKWAESSIEDHNRMTAVNLNLSKRQAKNNSFYISDKINAYYKRYYHSAFQIDKIRSVSKTKTEQMQKLYKIHKARENLWQKKKKFRSQSTV